MPQLSIKDLSVLLVEPSATQSKFIAGVLDDVGIWNIKTSGSIPEAISSMSTYPPDLIISTMYFENGTGCDLITHVRNDDVLQETPFILISSETSHAALDPVKQAGIVAILSKPFRLAELKKALYATVSQLEPEKIKEIDFEQLRILVVDDSTLARNHITRVLQNLGAKNITQVEDGIYAVEELKTKKFDLVVTDYNMPQMNGNELVDHIRTNSNQSSLPVLMITSEMNRVRSTAIGQEGVSALCGKPFDINNIRGLLKNILQ